MIETIRRAADGKLKCFFESTEGFPAFGMVRTKLGVDNIRAAPAELFDGDAICSDALLVFRVTSGIGKRPLPRLCHGPASFRGPALSQPNGCRHPGKSGRILRLGRNVVIQPL